MQITCNKKQDCYTSVIKYLYTMSTLQTFLTLLISSSALPLLAFLAIALRRKVVSGKLKMAVLLVSLLGLVYVVFQELSEHKGEFGTHDIYVGAIVSLLTFFLLSFGGHSHKHGAEESGIKGIIIAEAFHSLFDGLAIGVTFLVTPLLGATAALGILVHEIPKMIATIGLIRSLGVSMKKTILYGVMAQIGAPITAVTVYLLGIKLETEFKLADVAVIASLSTIVIYILFLEVRHHTKRKHYHGHPH